MRSAGSRLTHVLVVPGFETPFEAELKQRAGERVRFLGWVDDRTLDGLYRAATCFVLPSLAEGFGLPVLEAMARGTPVACSDISALREVAGDAALYFDPLDAASIARRPRECLDDVELRARLQRCGPGTLEAVHVEPNGRSRRSSATSAPLDEA